jgi:large conductance mechanosensitive channel
MPRKEKKAIKKKLAIIKEFREFISRGNVMDLAVGVIIGSAFTAIVNSVANNIITPVIGILIGGIDFSSLRVNLPSVYPEAEKPVLAYGVFIQAIINFFIIAVCVFIIIKFMNTLKSKVELEKKAEEKPPEKAADVLLLEEIRDLLKNQNNIKGETNETD